MSAAETLRVVQGYLDGHAVEWLSEDVEFRDMTRPEPMRGRDEVAAFLHLFFGQVFSEARIEQVRLTPAEDRVCAEWTFRGRHTGTLAGETPTGREISQPMASLYEVEGGEIRRARLYYDAAGLLAQLGVGATPAPASV
ncbi:MAG TPA: ester cyclase [Candidatus Limnocylindria bacterium]